MNQTAAGDEYEKLLEGLETATNFGWMDGDGTDALYKERQDGIDAAKELLRIYLVLAREEDSRRIAELEVNLRVAQRQSSLFEAVANDFAVERDAALVKVTELEAKNVALLAAIKEHRDQRGDDRCWLDDKKLYAITGEVTDEGDAALPPREVFLANCARYFECRQSGAPYFARDNALNSVRDLEEKITQMEIMDRRVCADYEERVSDIQAGYDVQVTRVKSLEAALEWASWRACVGLVRGGPGSNKDCECGNCREIRSLKGGGP